MAALWQQVLALDAKYNAYRAPNHPQFSKLCFAAKPYSLYLSILCKYFIEELDDMKLVTTQNTPIWRPT